MDELLIMELNYNLMLCNAAAVLVDKHLEMVHDWLAFLEWVEGLSNQEYQQSVKLAARSFIAKDLLWKHNLLISDLSALSNSKWTRAWIHSRLD